MGRGLDIALEHLHVTGTFRNLPLGLGTRLRDSALTQDAQEIGSSRTRRAARRVIYSPLGN